MYIRINFVINSLDMPQVLFRFRSRRCYHPATVEPFQFSPAEPVAYQGS